MDDRVKTLVERGRELLELVEKFTVGAEVDGAEFDFARWRFGAALADLIEAEPTG